MQGLFGNGGFCDGNQILFQQFNGTNVAFFQPKLLSQQKISNELKPGRILMVTYFRHYNKLGLLLSISTSSNKEVTYKVLVLDAETDVEHQLIRSDLWHRMVSLSHKCKTFQPKDHVFGHSVISVRAANVVAITKISLKCENDKIIQNWEQRQIPRFRDNPPSQSVVMAIEELNKLTQNDNLELLTLQSQSVDLVDDLQTMNNLKKIVVAQQPFTNRPTFEEDFGFVFDRKLLEEKKNNLQFQLSSKNLSLYPDYCNKLMVLQELKYIDEMHQGLFEGVVYGSQW